MTEYVYGIVEPGVAAPPGPGLAGAPVRLVRDGGAAALVSDMAGARLRLGREDLLAHADVLKQALSAGTVLPMRFGIVMAGDDEVRRRVLDQHAADLRAQLRHFRNKVEVSIRATYDQDALMRDVVTADPEIAKLREVLRHRPPDATYFERIALGERVAHAIEHRRSVDARNIVDALSPVALESLVGEPAHERVVLNAAFLVQRRGLTEFDDVLEAFAAGQSGRIRFKYTGPLPPHSFVSLTQWD